MPELILYEYEASPYCRRVRETLCVLGLRALILPCPRETLRLEGAYGSLARHKHKIKALGGHLLFPFLEDRTALLMDLTVPRAGVIFVLTAGMCLLAGRLALKKVQATDPADLF